MEIGSFGWYLVVVISIHFGILGLVYHSIENQSQAQEIKKIKKHQRSKNHKFSQELIVAKRSLRKWRNEARSLYNHLTDETPVKRRSVSAKLRNFILERDDFTCLYCGQRGTNNFDPDGQSWAIDHIQPVSRGGATAPGNLVTSCHSCNSTKSDKTATEYLKDRLAATRPTVVQRKRKSAKRRRSKMRRRQIRKP